MSGPRSAASSGMVATKPAFPAFKPVRSPHINKLHFNIPIIIMYRFILPSLLLAATSLHAAVLQMLPSPMAQGGMIHVNVSFNEDTNVLTAVPESGTPVLKPLTMWNPGDSFNPASPWYTTLDPSQSGGVFNSQFGLVLYNSDPLPSGSRILVSMLSASSGLGVYRWRNTDPQLFDGIMGTGGSSTAWDWSSAAHSMFHPMFVMPSGSSGGVSATLEFSLVDGLGTPLPGISSVQANLSFSAVPEPSGLALALVGACLCLRRKRTI